MNPVNSRKTSNDGDSNCQFDFFEFNSLNRIFRRCLSNYRPFSDNYFQTRCIEVLKKNKTETDLNSMRECVKEQRKIHDFEFWRIIN